MTKSKEKLKALRLRRQGKSIQTIATMVGVAKSSVSYWCRDIALTENQIQRLAQNTEENLRLGQLRGAESKRTKRLSIISKYENEGEEYSKDISQKEFFIFGIALYLCEGAKTQRRFIFTNSDPALIKIMTKWLYDYYQIDSTRLGFRVQIHEMHKSREKIIEQFWKKYLHLSPSATVVVNYIKTTRQKIYENINSYHGTMHLRVLKGTDFSYRIQGLIRGIVSRLNMPT